jgi:uncharacterized protein (TIGR04255 family)
MILANLPRQAGQRAYDFVSPDEVWTVRLTRDSIALTATKYERWQDFRRHLQVALDALADEYKPSFITRVGLRYQDVIRRSRLSLSDRPWRELLTGPIGGLLVSEINADVTQTFTQALLRLPGESGSVAMKHGLVEAADDRETCYLVDSDFFSDNRTNLEDVYGKLDFFNRQSGRLFRWCITDVLHEAMGPKSALPGG